MTGQHDVGVYLVTDGALCDRHGHGVLAVVRAAVAAGVRTVQVRDKDASARELLALVSAVTDVPSATRPTVVVDDRLDVALAARTADTGSPGCTSGSRTCRSPRRGRCSARTRTSA